MKTDNAGKNPNGRKRDKILIDHPKENLPQENPFPGDFSVAFMLGYGVRDEAQFNAVKKPFKTEPWKQAWDEIVRSKKKGFLTDLSFDGEIPDSFPGAAQRYELFKNEDGFYSLETLADKGADPNFILSVLVKYLWNENISAHEDEHYGVKYWKERLEGIKLTKEYYLQFYKKTLPLLLDPKDPNHPAISLHMDLFGGEARKEVELFLYDAEKKITRWLDRWDFRDPSKHHSQNDKINRTIFAIYAHLRQRTKTPHWETFWDLLVRAGAIKGTGKLSTKNGQIKSRIYGFIADNPREYVVMPSYIENWPVPEIHLLFPLP